MKSHPHHLMTMPEFFEEVYQKAKPKLGRDTIRTMRSIVDRFCQFVGRRITMNLVTVEMIEQFSASGQSPLTMRKNASQIRMIMRMFDPNKFPRFTYLKNRPVTAPRGQGPKKPKLSRHLFDYLEHHYYPDKEASGVELAPTTRHWYRGCSAKFIDVMGPLEMRQIDERTVWEFQRRLSEAGHTLLVATRMAEAISTIARHAVPEKWPKLHGGTPCLSWQNSDIKGTLEQIFMREYLPQRTRISSTQTVRQYGRCLRLFGEFLRRPATLSDLTDINIGKFLRWLVDKEGAGVKPVTANGYVKQIKALWNWAAKKRLVKEFPTIDKLPVPRLMPVAWSHEELLSLVQACRSFPGTVDGVPLAALFTAFHFVIWDSGERTGAMHELRWEWLDWKTGKLSVPAEFRKGRRTPMVYPLKEWTVDSLREVHRLASGRETMFELLLPSWRFYRLYRQLLESAGLPYVKSKSGPQKMRRTYASFIEAAGGNATRALKHVDRRCTEDSYIDPRIAETHHENDRLFSLAGE